MDKQHESEKIVNTLMHHEKDLVLLTIHEM
jgi:hypothetical protein